VAKKENTQGVVMSQDLTLMEMLWWDLKMAVNKRMSANLDELKQCCKEWVKIPPQ